MRIIETLIKNSDFVEHAIEERDECLMHMSECTRDIINTALHFAVAEKLFACNEDAIIIWLWISKLDRTGDNHLLPEFDVMHNGKLIEAFESEYNDRERKWERRTDYDLPF